MLTKPTFKASFHVERVEGEGVFLLSEQEYIILQGEVCVQLAPLLDGHHTVDQIVAVLHDDNAPLTSAAEVYYVLRQMEKAGYIVESDDTMPAAEAAFWHQANVDTRQIAARLHETTLSVTAFGDVPLAPFIALLESFGIQVGEAGDRSIALTDDYLREGLRAYNQEALSCKRPYMLLKPVGTTLWLGPIIHPERTGCWECLRRRLHTNRPAEAFLAHQHKNGTFSSRSVAHLESTVQTALYMAATEIMKWVAAEVHAQLEGSLVTFDTLTLTTQRHVLTRHPQCPCCGDAKDPNDRKAVPIALESRKKSFTAGGGHRAVPPEETFQRFTHHLSPITGVVRTLRRSSTVENGLIHSYSAQHNMAFTLEGETAPHELRENLRDRSAGKGRTDVEARTSGLCEALERYCGAFQGDEARCTGRYIDLGPEAIHPNACMLFSKAQYRDRETWNATCSNSFQKVPAPVEEDREIEWTPVWSLTHRTFRYLPTAYCYYNYPKSQNPFCRADSNGNAAGNTLEEAILQGFMELVERDAVALWWYNRVQRPEVDLTTFDEPYFQSLQAYYQTINRTLWVLDLTTDLEIPAFVAVSRRTDSDVEDILFGFGAHFDPQVGVMRALTEMNQLLPVVAQVTNEGHTRYLHTDKLAMDWWTTATVENQPYLVPDERVPSKSVSDYPDRSSDDLLEDVQACVAITEAHGLETLILDQTRPDIGLKVVKVIVPGLRHFWKRWGPGRLYEVPAKLGWVAMSLQEDQLNPIPMFV